MRPVPLQEFLHTCVLLSEQALISMHGTGAGGRASSSGGFRRGGATGKPQQQSEGKLSLRVMAQDIKAALRSNPVFRKIIGAE